MFNDPVVLVLIAVAAAAAAGLVQLIRNRRAVRPANPNAGPDNAIIPVIFAAQSANATASTGPTAPPPGDVAASSGASFDSGASGGSSN